MSDITVGELTKNGLWTNNPALVQLLGLCPLPAVTGTSKCIGAWISYYVGFGWLQCYRLPNSP